MKGDTEDMIDRDSGTDRKTDRQTERQTSEKQSDSQTDRQRWLLEVVTCDGDVRESVCVAKECNKRICVY